MVATVHLEELPDAFPGETCVGYIEDLSSSLGSCEHWGQGLHALIADIWVISHLELHHIVDCHKVVVKTRDALVRDIVAGNVEAD